MSIQYQDLHKMASELMPDSKIKPTSIWVGILVHSIGKLDQVKTGKDFLWLKCHPKITVRTLKHEYFSRHPLDDFEFKFDRNFIEETVQVKDLRRDAPIKSKLVVLRAFEEVHIDAEEDLEEQIDKESEQQNAQPGLEAPKKSKSPEKSDELDNDDESSKPNEGFSMSNLSTDSNVQADFNKKRKLNLDNNPDDDDRHSDDEEIGTLDEQTDKIGNDSMGQDHDVNEGDQAPSEEVIEPSIEDQYQFTFQSDEPHSIYGLEID